MTTNRKEGESQKQYTIRLCSNKDELGISYKDIANIVNAEFGLTNSESKYRKWWTAYKEGFVDGKELDVSDVEILEEIKTEKIQLQKTKFQMQDQKRELINQVRKEARFEHFRDEIIKAIQSLQDTKPLIQSPSLNVMSKEGIEALLLASDWHKGLFAKNYWNDFNNEEFVRRVQLLVERTINHCAVHNVHTLHFFSLGDLVNGLIHVTTRIMATEDVITQTMSVAEILAEILLVLSNNIPQIKYYHCRGNHDRVTPNKSDELEHESFADLVLWHLKTRLGNIKNIEFMENKFDDELVVANVSGVTVFGVHGHKDRPNEVIQNLTLMTKIIPDIVVMGHYHHHFEKEIHKDVEVVINNSLSGVDSYAKDIRRTSKSSQKLMIFTPEEGRLCTYNIRLAK